MAARAEGDFEIHPSAPVVEYSLLNEQAKLLYDAAFHAGYQEGVAAERGRQAREQAKSMHDLAAIALLATEDRDDVHARWAAALARTIMRRTPQVQGEVAVIIDLLTRAGASDTKPPDRTLLREAAQLNQHALSALGGYR